MSDPRSTPLLPELESLALIDHHCHGVVRRNLDRPGFEELLTEAGPAGSAGPLAHSPFDSQIGFAVRRWCAPVLDLEPHADPDAYLERRSELGHAEVTGRFLRAAGIAELCVDTGFEPEPLLTPDELGHAAGGAKAHEIVRLEQVAQQVAPGATAAGFADAVRTRLAERARTAVGFKSVAAYRVGLDLSAERPTEAEVADAAGRFLATLHDDAPPRLADETLHRFLIWCGVDLGLPIQFHVGYGDADVNLDRCDPLLLTRLLREIEPSGVPILLLHNYPFHRQAGFLAQVFSNVFLDVGLATHNLGRGSRALIAEALELAPFGKFLYSSDAFGLPELYYLGAVLFRHGLSDFLRSGVEDGEWSAHDADRVAAMISSANARRVYRLPH